MATDPNAWGSSGGPFDPKAWQNGATQIGQATQDVTNGIASGVATSMVSMFGVTPARAGKAIHQFLVGTAGALIIVLGFVMIVSGTKTGRSIASGVTSAVTKASEAAAIV